MVVVLIARTTGGVSVQPESLRMLGALGVTSVTLVRDDDSDGVVLDGWAFDAVRSTADALAALDRSARDARVLQPVTLMTIAPGPSRTTQRTRRTK